MGSQLVLRRARDIPGFLRSALAVRKQVRGSPGAIGVSLIAQPMRKTFWTLSAWRDQPALDAFVGAEPHSDVMARYRSRLTVAHFRFWNMTPSELPAPRSNARSLWDDARRRLASDDSSKGDSNG